MSSTSATQQHRFWITSSFLAPIVSLGISGAQAQQAHPGREREVRRGQPAGDLVDGGLPLLQGQQAAGQLAHQDHLDLVLRQAFASSGGPGGWTSSKRRSARCPAASPGHEDEDRGDAEDRE